MRAHVLLNLLLNELRKSDYNLLFSRTIGKKHKALHLTALI